MNRGHYQTANWEERGDWGHHGWGRPHGFFFFPPFALLFGFFLLFALFHTGLWVPLLFVGLFFWATRHHHRVQHLREFRQRMVEKRKHGPYGYGPMWGGWGPDEAEEKAKHDDYI
jgi:hypothetical protein